jgi:hypothetical protein
MLAYARDILLFAIIFALIFIIVRNKKNNIIEYSRVHIFTASIGCKQ